MRVISCVMVFLVTGLPARADGVPQVAHVGMVVSNILEITVRAGRTEYGRQVSYEHQMGDEITDADHHRWVKRDGEFIGSLVGEAGKILHTFGRVDGLPFDTEWADQPGNYRLVADGVSQAIIPEAVFRKSRPTDLVRTAPWGFDAPTEHRLYLQFSHPLAAQTRYTLQFVENPLQVLSFVIDPVRLRSDVVHVSQLGFRPDDPAKVAFLSCWMGNGRGVEYPQDLSFRVVENGSDRVVFEGDVRLSKAADDKTEDAYKHNHNGVDVYEMDFTPISTPGRYRVVVEGIGCSYPFTVGEDVWREAFTVSARGFYHQRSGIPLGPPYTSFKRPRPFHPDDGLKVHASTAALMDTGNGLNRADSNFGNLVRGKSDEIVPNAWGGYMDAADWDRRIQHLSVSRYLLELAELFPEYFAELSLNIPESNDGLPDIVSEALFNLDCYRRMQTPEGGVRGGIESSEHPRHGEASWQESLDVMAYAPGVWSSYVYAGVAARAAHWLVSRQPDLATVYQESALRAMRWAEAELPQRQDRDDPHAVTDTRNLAAAELFRLTGDPKWHRLFLQTTVFQESGVPLYQWQHHEQRDAAWVYLRTEQSGMDAGIRANCLEALRQEADERVSVGQQTAFRWTKNPWAPTAWGALSTPDAVSLVRAHIATQEVKYLKAIVLACQVGAGANPMNFCYTTGLGHRSPQHPMHIDSRLTHQPPPPGLTVFGPRDISSDKDYWIHPWINQFGSPPVEEWPVMEAYWDVFWSPPTCEYTVHQPMSTNAYVWGYLAARP